MELKDFKKNYVFTKRFDFADMGEECYIVVRELNYSELMQMDGKTSAEQMKLMSIVLPKAIVDHNFTNNNSKTDNQSVADALLSSGLSGVKLIQDWLVSLPLESIQEKKEK